MPALDAMSAHPGYRLGRTPRHGREEREWETLNASVKTGLWNEWGTSGALEQEEADGGMGEAEGESGRPA